MVPDFQMAFSPGGCHPNETESPWSPAPCNDSGIQKAKFYPYVQT